MGKQFRRKIALARIGQDDHDRLAHELRLPRQAVGYGHGREWWNDFVSTLRLVGYDGVLSIEHEDSLMSSMEGLSKAVALLKEALLFEKVSAMTWA